jgi:2-aminoadipate transaminase
MPNFQNPQGTTLPPERREQLVSLARESRVGLVEDDPYGELCFRGAPPPSLLSISLRDGKVNQSPVVQVGTFSKVIAPGLRVGWIIGAETVIEKLVRAKQALDLHTSTFNQLIIYELMRESFLDHHLPKLREAYRNRRDAMFAALESHWKNEATWTRPEGGMFLMVRLGQQVQASDLLRHALKRHVAFVPGEEFHWHGRGTDTFRLNFSNAKPDMIHEGVRRLAAALSDLPRPRKD